MILDADLQFSDAQAVTATAASTNSVDLSAVRDIGVGTPMYVVMNLTSALVGAGAIITVTLETDDNSAFSSATVSQTLGVFPALAAAGTKIVAPVAPAAMNERHARLKYTVSGGTLTGGALDAFLSNSYESVAYYADAVTIS